MQAEPLSNPLNFPLVRGENLSLTRSRQKMSVFDEPENLCSSYKNQKTINHRDTEKVKNEKSNKATV
jgi:hypothetical protein